MGEVAPEKEVESVEDNLHNQRIKAIEEEKMPWEQYLISGSDVTKMNAQFSISAIPIVIFVDKNRKKIKRFEGYSESKTGEYIKLIEDYLTKN